MSKPSQWPLTGDAIRLITPEFMRHHLADNPLTRACFLAAMGYYPEAKGHYMQRDQHDDNLVIFCVGGEGSLQTEHFDGPVGAGDLALLPAGTRHSYAAKPQNPWTIYWFHFDGQQTKLLFSALDYKARQPVIDIGMPPLLISDFKRLLSLRQSGYRHAVFDYASALLRQIMHFLALEIRSSKSVRHHQFNLDLLEGLMLENLNGQLDLDALATASNLSRHHFASKYKQLTGISPIKHFIHLKMEHACYLLDSRESSIKTVAAELDYQDPLYFSRQFSKVIGMSPKEYRQRRRG